ncbi:MAG: hypothetical protein WC680_08910 [Sulfuricurvum sp.]
MKRLLWLLMVGFTLAAGETKIEMHLNVAQGGLLSTAIIQRVLGSMGFIVDTHRLSRSEGIIEMDLLLHGKKGLDVEAFVEKLREHQITAQNKQLKNKQSVIELDASQVFWNLPAISEDEGAQLERTTLPYWFAVNKSKGISVEAPYGNQWFPEIAIFDENMQVLASLKEFQARDRMSFKLPEHAVYLKVSNANGMKLLKEGMWIESANDEQQ